MFRIIRIVTFSPAVKPRHTYGLDHPEIVEHRPAAFQAHYNKRVKISIDL